MKKRLYIIGMVLVLCCSMTACGKKKKSNDNDVETSADALDESEVKDEILTFLNTSLPAIDGEREQAVLLYNSYYDGSVGDMTAYVDSLKNTAIPNMEAFTVSLTNLEVSSEEVSNLKGMYLLIANKQCEAMKYVVDAIEEKDSDFLDSAEQCINDAKDMMNEYKAYVNELCSKYDILIDGVPVSTTTDAVAAESVSE